MKNKALRIAVAAAAFALASGAAAAQDAVKLKFATFGSTVNPIVRCGPMSLLDEITKRSGGKVTFENYIGASSFSAPPKLYEQVAKGIMDLSWGLQDYSPGRFPMSEVISLPFVAEDNLAAARAVAKLFPKFLAQEYQDVHVIMLPMVSPYQLHSRSPITKIEDIKGLRIRGAGVGIKASLEDLGAAVSVMPSTLQYESLQKGVIDATMGTWATLIAFKLNEIVTHHAALNFATLPAFMVMSKKSYAALTSAQKTIVELALDAGEGGGDLQMLDQGRYTRDRRGEEAWPHHLRADRGRAGNMAQGDAAFGGSDFGQHRGQRPSGARLLYGAQGGD